MPRVTPSLTSPIRRRQDEEVRALRHAAMIFERNSFVPPLPRKKNQHSWAKCITRSFQTNVGPIVLSMNPYRDVGNPLTLNSTRNCARSPELTKVVEEVIRLQGESGYPQAIIISGASGSGKTHTSMVLLRQLFQSSGGGTETDTFKHLAASFTVLRSLGTAKTTANRESSRIVSCDVAHLSYSFRRIVAW